MRLSSVTSRLAGSAPGTSSSMTTLSPFSRMSAGGVKIGPASACSAEPAGPWVVIWFIVDSCAFAVSGLRDLDLARLVLCGTGQRQGDDAALELGGRLLGVDAER